MIVSTVGYCLIPLALVGLFTSLLHSVLNGVVKFILLVFALSWSCMSCMLIMRDLVSQERKWLCTYPICLFYIFLAWYAVIAWYQCKNQRTSLNIIAYLFHIKGYGLTGLKVFKVYNILKINEFHFWFQVMLLSDLFLFS